MHTKRDQVKAYRFLVRRINSALLAADPNAPEQPMRRLFAAAVASVAVAVLLAAGMALYGLVVPGHADSWRDGRSIIVAKDSNTRFIYADGVLHPVLNWASARLIIGSGEPAVVKVSAQSLRGIPRGLPVGIPGGPEELPRPTDLLNAAWTSCSQLAPKPDGSTRPATVLSVAAAPAPPAIADDEAVLVRGSDGVLYLLWQGQRLRITAPFVVTALGLAAVAPRPVSSALLTVIPQGRDLAPIPVDGMGAPGPSMAGRGTVLGQVFLVRPGAGANEQSYLLVQVGSGAGLRPLTALQAAIQLADPRTAAAYGGGEPTPVPLASAAAAVLRATPTSAQDSALPAQAPRPVRLAPQQAQVCAVHGDPAQNSHTRRLVARVADPVSVTVPPAEPVDPAGGPLADAVVVPPGGGVLVRAESSPGAPTGTVHLVTSLGMKYPIDGDGVLASLGLAGVTPVAVPAELVQLLPTGPALSAQAAREEHPPAGPASPAGGS